MRVLLHRLQPGDRLEPGAVEALAGQPVYAAASRQVVGRVVRAELDGLDLWGWLDLDRALLPHELDVPVSIARVGMTGRIS